MIHLTCIDNYTKFEERKLTTKKNKCKQILKYISDVSRFDIFNITEDVECHERTVYRALNELKIDKIKMSKHVKKLEALEDKLVTLYHMLNEKFTPISEPSLKEIKVIRYIEKKLLEDIP